ncbi:MAG: VOC family protein [Bacteroidota bacterium]
MQVNPYLNFNGQCRVAFEFYQKCLGGEIVAMQTHGNSPMAEHVPTDWHDSIIHARMVVGDTVLMGSDLPPQDYGQPKGFAISITVDDAAEADRIFNALAENGTVQMPIQETFWATRFGMFTDQYGTPWMINCDKHA